MSKYLLAYKINNQILGIDIETWNNSDLNGNSAFIVINRTESIPDNYENISSIENWSRFGMSLVNDYLVGKAEIKNIVVETGWSGLTNLEKDLAIQYYSFVTPIDAVTYLMTVKGYTQDFAQLFLLQQWHRHHANSTNTAKKRWYYVKLTVSKYLSFYDSEDLLNSVEPLIFPLMDIARLGINYGDKKEGIMDYIESTGIFTGQGLRENNYTLLVGDYDIFIGELKNVIVDGIYNKYSDIKID